MLDDCDNWMYCDDSQVVQAAGEIPSWGKDICLRDSKFISKMPIRQRIRLGSV
jgi:hypothetical protein